MLPQNLPESPQVAPGTNTAQEMFQMAALEPVFFGVRLQCFRDYLGRGQLGGLSTLLQNLPERLQVALGTKTAQEMLRMTTSDIFFGA